jgi:hypothetical protein
MDHQQALADFYARYPGIGLLSTGARVVPYAGVLYNVEGSSIDPPLDPDGWKQLLLDNGIDGDCYVTHPLPEEGRGRSHPADSVGGHMTPDAEGRVETGGICYLMPLCKWHNHTRRNRTPFEHDETEMLELSGYMMADLAATFLARMPGEAEFRLVSVEGEALRVRAIDAPLVQLFNVHRDTGIADPALPRTYLRFRRVEEGGVVRFVIDDARLPILR